MKRDILTGTVVQSAAGRDQGRLFVVFDVIDDKYVLIADGDLHKITSKKKKNIKHIATKPFFYDKILDGKTAEVIDAEIRKYLKNVSKDSE